MSHSDITCFNIEDTVPKIYNDKIFNDNNLYEIYEYIFSVFYKGVDFNTVIDLQPKPDTLSLGIYTYFIFLLNSFPSSNKLSDIANKIQNNSNTLERIHQINKLMLNKQITINFVKWGYNSQCLMICLLSRIKQLYSIIEDKVNNYNKNVIKRKQITINSYLTNNIVKLNESSSLGVLIMFLVVLGKLLFVIKNEYLNLLFKDIVCSFTETGFDRQLFINPSKLISTYLTSTNSMDIITDLKSPLFIIDAIQMYKSYENILANLLKLNLDTNSLLYINNQIQDNSTLKSSRKYNENNNFNKNFNKKFNQDNLNGDNKNNRNDKTIKVITNLSNIEIKIFKDTICILNDIILNKILDINYDIFTFFKSISRTFYFQVKDPSQFFLWMVINSKTSESNLAYIIKPIKDSKNQQYTYYSVKEQITVDKSLEEHLPTVKMPSFAPVIGTLEYLKSFKSYSFFNIKSKKTSLDNNMVNSIIIKLINNAYYIWVGKDQSQSNLLESDANFVIEKPASNEWTLYRKCGNPAGMLANITFIKKLKLYKIDTSEMIPMEFIVLLFSLPIINKTNDTNITKKISKTTVVNPINNCKNNPYLYWEYSHL